MVSHFEDIGFNIKNKDDFKLFINRIVQNGKKKPTKIGNYYLFSPDGKIEVWVFTKQGDFRTITPFYNGKSKLPVLIENIFESENKATKIRCWVNPNEKSDDGEVPFVFEVPDYWLVNKSLKTKGRHFIRLTAFAEEASFYENEQDFSKNAPINKEIRESTKKFPRDRQIRGYASNHFIPLGTFSKTEGQEDETNAKFAGKIKELQLITNKFTKNNFYWMVVETFFGELDVVCAEKAFSSKPKVGGILDGTFYLGGKFSFTKKENLISRIFKKSGLGST